jgi:hypothetical protein
VSIIIKKIIYKEQVYEVTDTGQVFKDGKELNQNINHDGYLVVATKDYNKQWRNTGVHRLVALAFLKNDDPFKNEVNHKDFNRQNNNLCNLQWVTHKENVQYSLCNRPDIRGKLNPNYGNKKLSERYAKNSLLAKEKQSRKGLQNGRCRKITIFKDNKPLQTFEYIDLCCEYLIANGYCNAKKSSVRSKIDRAVRNNEKYKGFTFQKH